MFTNPTTTRKRGVILTTLGWKKLQQAISKAEFESNYGERYTYDRLAERISLDPVTISKVIDRQKAVDRRTLSLVFQAFDLELEADDFTHRTMHPADRRQHWGQAVDVSAFFGRREELNELEHWIIEDHCRLVMLLGMGGVGKTTLSIKLAEGIQERFDHVIWRSLRNAPLLVDLLDDLLECLSQERPITLDAKLARLNTTLREQRCLLILDNIDAIFCDNTSAGYYQQGYEGYGTFFKGVAEVSHQSCLVITSREKPAELGVIEGRTRPIRVFQLCGLGEAEGKEILKAKDLIVSEMNPDWKVLISHYSGNPLALQIVATMIRELLDGDISAFVQLLKHGTVLFDDIRDLLDQQFRRLSEFEKEVMYWIAIERKGIDLGTLRENIIAPVPETKLWEALRSLGRRSLVVKSDTRYILQPALLEYVSDRLIEQISSEIIARKIGLIDRFALMPVQGCEEVCEIQTRLMLKPIIERLLAFLGCQMVIERRLAELIWDLRRESTRSTGYAVSNVLNLMSYLNCDLSNYDFSGLHQRRIQLHWNEQSPGEHAS